MKEPDVIENLGAYRRRIFVYLPDTEVRQLVYFHGTPGDGRQLGEGLWENLETFFHETGAGLVMLEVEDWNRDLSPWPAEGVSPRGEDFAGGGRAYLEDLCRQVIPQVEGQYAQLSHIQRRMIGGYSMGGLFALYAMLESPIFTDIISVSGSLWYEGIVEYVSGKIAGEGEMPGRGYFSLGQREPKTRNPRMKRVGEQTAAIRDIMAERGFPVHFQWNPGNHFQDELGRIERAMRFMLGRKG